MKLKLSLLLILIVVVIVGCTMYPARYHHPSDLPPDDPATNTYTALVHKQGKVKQTCATGGTIWVDGTATFKNYTNGNYFFPGTNWFVFDFSNSIPMIVWNDGDGNGGCGFGHLVVTDSIFPGTPVAFDLRWPTNLPIPTNPVPMTVVNLKSSP